MDWRELENKVGLDSNDLRLMNQLFPGGKFARSKYLYLQEESPEFLEQLEKDGTFNEYFENIGKKLDSNFDMVFKELRDKEMTEELARRDPIKYLNMPELLAAEAREIVMAQVPNA